MPWIRATRQAPCVICGATKWCSHTADHALALCMHVAEGAVKAAGASGGWLHRTGQVNRADYDYIPRTKPVAMAPDYTEAVTNLGRAFRADVDREAHRLGLAPWSVHLLGACWIKNGLGVAMKNARGRAVGVRIRWPNGRKAALEGSREGVFAHLPLPATGTVVVPEGPSTTASLIGIGMIAVGRPSAFPGEAAVTILRALLRDRDAVIAAENDPRPDGSWPGLQGAERTAEALLPVCKSVRVIFPPVGKDFRDSITAGVSKLDVEDLIEKAEPRALTVKAGNG